MIAALALPAAATARGYDAPGWGGARPSAAWGGGRPGGGWGGPRPGNVRPYGGGFGRQGGFGGYRPEQVPGPQMIYHGIPGFGGYARPRLRDPDDWNDYGAQRGEAWRRGQVFPQGARGAIVGDYGRYHLRRPPPGYYWYRSGDDFILAAIASGLIFEVAPADGY